MPQLRRMRHYVRAFIEAVEADGLGYALRRAGGFVRRKIRNRGLAGFPPDPPNIFGPIVDTLPITPLDRPLLLIISDTAIRQCIHYRIEQKLRLLEKIGIQAMFFSADQRARFMGFLGLAHTVIVYRTAADATLIQAIRDAGANLVFEFDDLVVGRPAMEGSGILDQVTERQALHLRKLSDDLLATAQQADALIVSTDHLADLYAKQENQLAGKPSHVLPNFIEAEHYAAPGQRDFTFAYTSPSGSIRNELEMLKGLLTSYDAVADRDWSILVMGNDLARKELEAIPFRRGQVQYHPFSSFDEYLATIARAELVLIPLSDTNFNRSKTAIRLMDAAVAGTPALFCPVGAYDAIREALRDDISCLPSHEWHDAGPRVADMLERQNMLIADLQQAIERIYGVAAAEERYRTLFMDELHVPSSLATMEEAQS